MEQAISTYSPALHPKLRVAVHARFPVSGLIYSTEPPASSTHVSVPRSRFTPSSVAPDAQRPCATKKFVLTHMEPRHIRSGSKDSSSLDTVGSFRFPPKRSGARISLRIASSCLRSTLSSALCGPIFYGSWDEDSGLRMAGELLASSASFDAVACGNDRIALGVIRRLEMEGIRVPDDVLVIGFDDHPVAARTAPSITSVQQQFKHQGVRAVEIALSMLEGNGPVTEILKTRIQERESTSPSNAL